MSANLACGGSPGGHPPYGLNQPSPAARIAQAAVEVLSSTLEAPVLETQPVIFICT